MKTSAISRYNAAVTIQSGRVGNVRYVQRYGETYVRSASNSKKTNSRTEGQMVQRLKFASLVALYSHMKDYLSGAFPQREDNQSNYNAFMQANQGLGVYRTKDDVLDKVVYALPATIARGGLGTVTCEINNGVAVSNIPVGTLAIGTSTTLMDLSLALIDNDNWKNGDQLTVLSAVQNGTDVSVKAVRIFLDKEDNTTLLSAFGTFSVSGGCLAYAFSGQGCIGFIHSNKKDASKSIMTATATQQALIESLLSDENYTACALSYGESDENYITGNGTSGTSTTSGSSSNSGTSSGSTTKYTVTLVASPAAGGSVSGAGQYTAGTTVTVKANALSGYKFSQWSDGNTSATRSVTVNSNISLTATFVEDAGASTVPDGDEAEA